MTSSEKQSFLDKDISSMKHRTIKDYDVLADFRVSSLILDPSDDIDQMVDISDSISRDLVDQYAPLRTKDMLRRQLFRWNSQDIQTVKRHCIMNSYGSGLASLIIMKYSRLVKRTLIIPLSLPKTQ